VDGGFGVIDWAAHNALLATAGEVAVRARDARVLRILALLRENGL
jgi:hypothetical protein